MIRTARLPLASIIALAAAIAATAPTVLASAAEPGDQAAPPTVAVAQKLVAVGQGSTPELLAAAVRDGVLTPIQADRYLAYALTAPARLPSAYVSEAPWRGTLAILHLQQRAEAGQLPPDVARLVDAGSTDVARLRPRGNRSTCSNKGPLPDTATTDFFRIHYDRSELRGLKIAAYRSSLDRAFRAEVRRFGWWKPPRVDGAGAKYHVYVASLPPGLYGFTTTNGSYAGPVGNNPHTPWADHDAFATCLVMSNDFRGFPSGKRGALDSTSAHEYNHSLQFGIGGLAGPKRPTIVFFEGIATYMEDEVWDTANDSWYYLWPDFPTQMARYDDFPYSYWVIFRGMLEQYGTGTRNGGQLVARRFFELTSKEVAGNVGAWEQALADAQGGDLGEDYHEASIALKFLKRCNADYAYPYCLQEANGYRRIAGPTIQQRKIGAIGGAATGSVRDNYALNWVGLPGSGTYDVTVENTDAGGQLATSVVCDTGSGLDVDSLGTLGGGDSDQVAVDADACVTRPIAVISNVRQAGENPPTSTARSYEVTTAP